MSNSATQAVIQAIKAFHGVGYQGGLSATMDAVVTASVHGDIKVDRKTIMVVMAFDGTNTAIVDIMWDDYGIDNFSSLGLFGRMKTMFLEGDFKDDILKLTDGPIAITIELP